MFTKGTGKDIQVGSQCIFLYSRPIYVITIDIVNAIVKITFRNNFFHC